MKKVIYSVALVASLFTLAACGNDDAKEADTEAVATDKKEETSSAAKKDVYFDGETAKLKDVAVTIKETKVIPVGEPGNEYGDKPVLAIWYDAKNLSDKDIDPNTAWIAVFSAVQDNDSNAVNTLNVGMIPDQSHLDSQLQTIKKDGTVENSIAYELDDLTTPVTLIATQGLGGDELGRKEIKVD